MGTGSVGPSRQVPRSLSERAERPAPPVGRFRDRDKKRDIDKAIKFYKNEKRGSKESADLKNKVMYDIKVQMRVSRRAFP